MARPLRLQWAGAWYHVTSRGNERKTIFQDEAECRHFLELLGRMTSLYQLRLHVYVLMRNHYHLVLETPEANLSLAMQWLNTSYSQWFNRRHRRRGHLLEGRFKAVVVDQQRWGLELSRYVHLNPIRVKGMGLDKVARQRYRTGVEEGGTARAWRLRRDQLRAYPWSSYPAYGGWERPPEWLHCGTILGMVGRKSQHHCQQAYRGYVEAALREGLSGAPWEHVKGQVVLGSEEFFEQVRERMQEDPREYTGMRALRKPAGLEEVVKVVEKLKAERWEEFRQRHGDWGRDLVLMLARQYCGMKLKELGKLAGGIDYSSVSVALRRLQQRLKEDHQLAGWYRKAQTELNDKKI